ncbi:MULTISPECIES: diguanylate cyclase domain-containing protein [unclassified Rhizobium]|uniref:diguanylate cyclase domain-containing protein n=1 Tax=unclassified Rhizobium TaxID=2613769 RepID=UPI00177F3F1D|nr:MULTISPECIES: diguanylate cyclase [unclassified Rhizobium]MBD8687233.1 diguanylate cyclase [Rhizobium sp. CFBP 13644]MBD8690964.1 diguanylate cyclase [Rhizobium sp. CFBP 13717]
MQPKNGLDEDSAEVRLALFDFAFAHAPIGVAVVDVEGRILRANDAFSRLVGISQAALHRMPFADFTHPDDLEADMILFRQVLAGKRDGYTIEKRYVRPDGRIVEVVIHIAAMRDTSGKVIRFLSQIEDITVHKEHERQLAEKAAQLELAMEAVRGGFWHMDVSTDTFETSDRLAAFIGGPEAARLDLQRYLEKVNPEDSSAADLTPLLSGAVDQSVAEYRLDTVFGEKWMRCDRRLLRDTNGKPRRIVGVAIDFTDEHRRLEASERNAESDTLTGFLNRRGLANQYGRMTTASGIGVLAIDLDGFKQVNDIFGHPAGDAVLEETARRLRLCIRQTDLAARIGGDEFVLIIAGDRQAVEDVAERVVLAMRKSISLGDAQADVRVTVGGIWSDAKINLARLVSQADAVLYAAKAGGKDRWATEVPR